MRAPGRPFLLVPDPGSEAAGPGAGEPAAAGSRVPPPAAGSPPAADPAAERRSRPAECPGTPGPWWPVRGCSARSGGAEACPRDRGRPGSVRRRRRCRASAGPCATDAAPAEVSVWRTTAGCGHLAGRRSPSDGLRPRAHRFRARRPHAPRPREPPSGQRPHGKRLRGEPPQACSPVRSAERSPARSPRPRTGPRPARPRTPPGSSRRGRTVAPRPPGRGPAPDRRRAVCPSPRGRERRRSRGIPDPPGRRSPGCPDPSERRSRLPPAGRCRTRPPAGRRRSARPSGAWVIRCAGAANCSAIGAGAWPVAPWCAGTDCGSLHAPCAPGMSSRSSSSEWVSDGSWKVYAPGMPGCSTTPAFSGIPSPGIWPVSVMHTPRPSLVILPRRPGRPAPRT